LNLGVARLPAPIGHQVNAWTYVKYLLTEMPARRLGADLTDLLPDVWLISHTAAVSLG
jgi:hypothetical protein